MALFHSSDYSSLKHFIVFVCVHDAESCQYLLYFGQYLLFVCVLLVLFVYLYLSSNPNVRVYNVVLPHCHAVCFRSSVFLGAARGSVRLGTGSPLSGMC